MICKLHKYLCMIEGWASDGTSSEISVKIKVLPNGSLSSSVIKVFQYHINSRFTTVLGMANGNKI